MIFLHIHSFIQIQMDEIRKKLSMHWANVMFDSSIKNQGHDR
jgi:hypothetical protein